MSDRPLLGELKREVVLRPDDPAPRFQLAEALFGDGDFRGAARQLERAVALDPEHANARRLLAHAYERDGRSSDAVRLMEETARRCPDDVGARDELTELYLSIGRVDDALVHAEEAARLQPNEPKRFVTVGELCRGRRLHERARTALETAQRLAPEDPRIAEMLRELYLELGDETASERLAGARGREHYLAQSRRALTDRRLGPLTGAVGEAGARLAVGDVAGCRRALGLAPGEVSAASQFLHGELHLIDGELARAEQAFRACVARAPELGVAYNRLGDLLQTRGQLREAVAQYKKAILFCPEDANAYEDLGDIYATLGEKADAQRMYEAAHKRDPEGRARDKLDSLTVVSTLKADAPQVGKIGVLGWTPSGGAVSPLEAVAVVGRGELIFSGNVGPTSREAGLVAFSCLKARARELQIHELVVSYDLHLHFTDTEMGKDGPSAGLALVLVAVSAYCQRPLKERLAATGEITIHGEVKPVGGIHEKLVAAHLAGIRTVLLPRRNLREGRDLPDEVAGRLRLIYVDTVKDAIEQAFLDA